MEKGTVAGIVYLVLSVLWRTAAEPLEVRIGALFTSGRCCTIQSFEDKASAINIAIDQLEIDGVLNKSQVKFE